MAAILAWLTANQAWLVPVASAALAWLARHRGYGDGWLSSLAAAPIAPKSQSATPDAPRMPNLSVDGLRAFIRSELAELKPFRRFGQQGDAEAGDSPPVITDAHMAMQFLIDHPELKDELLKVVAGLAAKANRPKA